MEPRTEGRRYSLAFAVALVVSSSLAACSLDFHRFVPPDGDADAGDAQLEAVAIDAAEAPSTQVAAITGDLAGTKARVATTSQCRDSRTTSLPALRRPRAS